MTFTTRRKILASVAAAAALPLVNDLTGNGSQAVAEDSTGSGTVEFSSNTALYSSSAFKEGEDWMRRFQCSPRPGFADNLRNTTGPIRSTAVIAPHGGSIEAGTSELCLAIAGYDHSADPVTELQDKLPAAVPGAVQRDYWMFEALRNGGPQHVTSTHCDDPAALAVCANNLYAVSLHGFSPDEGPAKQILIGGRDQRLMHNLAWAFDKYGFKPGNDTSAPLSVTVTIAAPNTRINGDDPANIVNRTRTGAGAQLEISTELRKAMFLSWDSAANRRSGAGKGDQNQAHFWNGFVSAVREAMHVHELGLANAEPPTGA
ncbi:uncharacterized protein DUF867 [Streptomyces sp. PanSC19]|uniref:poly-gamma-glutamate hydrolase family protein n=1 Tax=Streptomyces sp. PanSC19 TaxID=1520455 RepID=UPI000F4703B6|nr:poly-gamma-glutamate hydrolase family protein [Streptomyces sp. PanSC19]ROQ36216.1 uncharacterized protein DUF867 [Streptomyces sp. PanSC19]